MEKNFDYNTVSLKKFDTGCGYGYGYYIEDPDTHEDLEIIQVYKSVTKYQIINGEKYEDGRYFTIKSNNYNCEIIPDSIKEQIVSEAIMFVLSHNKLLEVLDNDKYLNSYINRYEDKVLVKDIDVIALDGEYDVNDEVLCKFIEKPVRKACISLTNNGIKTLMSSCNKKNFYNPDLKVEEQLYIGYYDQSKNAWPIGNGYAWIMIDWEELNDDNKAYLLCLHDGIKSINLNEKEQLRLNNISDGKQSNLIKLYEYRRVDEFISALLESMSIKEKQRLLLTINGKTLNEDDNYDARSEVLYGCNSLNNHGSHYRTVLIRYPIDEETTIKEVEDYYDSITKQLLANQPKLEDNKEKILEFV